VDPAGGKLPHEQHVQALEQHRVGVEEVARQDPLGLGGQELPPGQPCTTWRRVDAGSVEEQPHGTWCDLVPESGELTVDAPITPRRVLGCQPQDQVP
jgi:hypothetical protein